MANVLVCSPGETILPQAQHSVGPAGSVCGHPEAVQLSRTDQDPGTPEAAQSALPHTGPTQCPRFQVTPFEHVTTSQTTPHVHMSLRNKSYLIFF